MHNRLIRFAAVAGTLVAATVATAALPSTGAFAAGPIGTNTLTPATGNTATTFTLLPPSGASCTGGGSTGYNWQTYIVDAGVDASTLTYAGGPNAVAGHFASALFDSNGNPVADQNPSSSPVGLISGIPTFSFSSLAGFLTAPGAYKIGFACTTNGNLDAGKYWETPITVSNVTATSFNYAFGAPATVPAAPVLGALTSGDTTLAGSFTATASTPATTGFTVTAHPASGPDITLPVAAAGSFTLTGLTNNTSYAVSVIATNSAGNSAPSNVVNGTPIPAQRPAITNYVASQTTPGVHVMFTAPAPGSPTGYTIGITPAVTGAPTTAAAGATSFDINGLLDNTPYTITLTANYAANPTTGPTAQLIFTHVGQILIQDITVTRPAGALILTQVCGVTSGFPGGAATNAFPATQIIPAVSSGTGPTLNAGPVSGTNPIDPRYVAGEYPYPSPATYPTHCAVNLGNAAFVTTGPLAGQYYAASGSLSQVTVVDNRDATFAGWTINGTLPSFAGAGSNSFNGSYLGWEPKASGSTGQVVAPGPNVDPTATVGGGLSTSKVLASSIAPATARGVATLDARLKVLIPVSVAAGSYTGVLSITAS